MAVCAICGGGLVRGDISIAGSEVFHKACIRAHGTASSALQRARAQALTADQEKHAAAVASQQTLERRDAIIRDLNAETRDLRRQLDQKDRELAQQAVTVLAQRAELYEATTDVARLQRELAEAKRAAEAARSEAAFHQTIQRSSPVSVARDTVRTVPDEVDDRDPTEVRMSLLDLDLDKQPSK